MKTRKGLLITLEGIEGCGKSSQQGHLAATLMIKTATPKVRMIRSPGSTPAGEDMREVFKHGHAMRPLTELLLVCAAKAECVTNVIRPALEAGEIVICDRFYDSTYSYQGYGRGLSMSTVGKAVDMAVGDIRPDLTLLFRISKETSLQRRTTRAKEGTPKKDRFDSEEDFFFDRVSRGFDALAILHPGRIKVIDGERTPEEVTKLAWGHIEVLLDSPK